MPLLRITVNPRLYPGGPYKQVNLHLNAEVYEFLNKRRYDLTNEINNYIMIRHTSFADLAVRYRAGYVGAVQRILHQLYPTLPSIWPLVRKAANGRYIADD